MCDLYTDFAVLGMYIRVAHGHQCGKENLLVGNMRVPNSHRGGLLSQSTKNLKMGHDYGKASKQGYRFVISG